MDSTLPVYLIHWNRPTWCESAVNSILGSYTKDVEITVIDNDSEDVDLLQQLLPEEVALVQLPKNIGYTGGANVALRHAKINHPDSAYVLIGSHDLHVAPECIDMLLAAIRSNPRAGIVGPGLLHPGSQGPGSSGGVWRGFRHAQEPLTNASGLTERDYLSGTCLLVNQQCARDIGEFDSSFGSYVEDVDYCLRARDAGWSVYVEPAARAWGLGSASDSADRMIEANWLRLVWKRRGRWYLLAWTANNLLRCFRSFGGSIAPWRERHVRQRSLAYGLNILKASVESTRFLWRRPPATHG